MNNEKLGKELMVLINKYSSENGSDTPDFLLDKYIIGAIKNYNYAIKRRDDYMECARNEIINVEPFRTTSKGRVVRTLEQTKTMRFPYPSEPDL